jgi:NAD-dependent SIR2 family protein deacetylase
MDELRRLVKRRPRGIGKLRPSVVLYNEVHRDAERIGEAVQKDLIGISRGKGADMLLVVGTSLRVPGTRRIMREFAKALHSHSSHPSVKDRSGTQPLSPSLSPC